MTNNNGRFPGVCSSDLSEDGKASADKGICKTTLKYINSSDSNESSLADDPSGNDYALSVVQFTGTADSDKALVGGEEGVGDTNSNTGSKVYVVQYADCSGKDSNDQSMPQYAKGSRNFAIYGQLENGTYCAESK